MLVVEWIESGEGGGRWGRRETNERIELNEFSFVEFDSVQLRERRTRVSDSVFSMSPPRSIPTPSYSLSSPNETILARLVDTHCHVTDNEIVDDSHILRTRTSKLVSRVQSRPDAGSRTDNVVPTALSLYLSLSPRLR